MKKKKNPVPAKRRNRKMLCLAAVILAAAIAAGGFAAWRLTRPAPMELPYLMSDCIAVVEMRTGVFVYEKNTDIPRSPASLTKLMTLFLVLDDVESGALSWDDTCTVTAAEAYTPGSKFGIKPGEVYTVRQLVAGTAMVSGCDCVQCLVRMCADREEDFIQRMNDKAEQLGLEGTHFINATGIDAEGHYMTAHDIAVLAWTLVREHPELLEFTSADTLTDGEYTFRNINRLVGADERVLGLKTGTTEFGGYNLVTLAQEDGKQYLIVLLNSENDNARYSETEIILDILFKEE